MIARRLVALAALIALTLWPGPAAWGAEQERAVVFLPETANVTGSELLLGEVAELQGPSDLVQQLAAIKVGAAPSMGSSRVLTRGHIEVRLRQGGVHPSLVEFQGAESVRVFRVTEEPADSPPAQGADRLVQEVVVAARDLRRGEILTADDLQVELREIRGGWGEGRSLEEFLGLRTTRMVLAGTPLTELHVEAVPLIERGTAVTILVHTGSVTVTAPGIARQSGGLGDLIEVENTLSRQRVTGEVIDAHTVQVHTKGAGMP
mgnify:CR=1 FL=1